MYRVQVNGYMWAVYADDFAQAVERGVTIFRWSVRGEAIQRVSVEMTHVR